MIDVIRGQLLGKVCNLRLNLRWKFANTRDEALSRSRRAADSALGPQGASSSTDYVVSILSDNMAPAVDAKVIQRKRILEFGKIN